MKVYELKNLLKTVPDDAIIMVPADEYNYLEATKIKTCYNQYDENFSGDIISQTKCPPILLIE